MYQVHQVHQGNSIDIHSFLQKLPLRNTPLGELHYYHPVDKKFDAYTGPFTDLKRRCKSNCNGENPRDFNSTEYIYDGVSKISHIHDHDYENAENTGLEREKVKELKLEADRKMLSALENLDCNSFGEKVKKKVAQSIIGLKVKLGLGISNLNLSEILGLGYYTEDEAKKIANELHHPVIRRFPTRKVICYGKDELFTSDLCEINYEKHNKTARKFKYILIVLDVYTRYLWTIILTNKRGETITNAFEELLKKTKRIPKLLWVDEGREYFNKTFQDFLKTKNVHIYHTYSERKACLAERVIRTLREMMEKEITKNQLAKIEEDWTNILERITRVYNSREHRSIKMSPIEASKDENQGLLKEIYEQKKKDKRIKPKFKVGDYVRLYRWKTIFEKGSKSNFTKEVFKITKILPTVPPVYRICDKNGEEILGNIYAEELVKSEVE